MFSGEQSESAMDSQCQEESPTSSISSSNKDQMVCTKRSEFNSNTHNDTNMPSDTCTLIPPDPDSATPCERYAFYLRSYYTRNRKPDDKWPGFEAKEYTNLAVISNEYKCREDFEDMRKATIYGSIDDILQGKNSIGFADVLKPNDINGKAYSIKQVLLEGAPGIGKSTMSWELCRKWGNGELFQEYSLVVMLRFRDPWVQNVKTLSDLFRFPGEHKLQNEIAKQIKQTQGKGLLLILEGYDEAPSSLREPNSLFSELFTGVLLPNATVMVTSRPSATQCLRQYCKGESSCRIEVLGFGKKEIKSYIASHFSETQSQEDFFKYLELYPHISSMMYVPLNAAIVTHVYQVSKTTATLVPRTMTELYTALVKTLLLRYLKEIPEYKGIRIDDFSNLPKPVYDKFYEVCQLAYDGIVQQETRIIFSDLPDEFDSLGLMQSIPELYIDEGASFSYNFLHLTVQEFLAAYHLSLLSDDQIESFLVENLEKRAMVCRFLAGHRQNNVMPVCKAIFKQTSLNNSNKLSVDIPALLMLFEFHNPHAIARMFQSKIVFFEDETNGYLKSLNVYPFDYYVLGYCICASSCSWDLTLSHVGIANLSMLKKALHFFNNRTNQPTRDGPAVTHALTIIGTDGMLESRIKPVKFGILVDCMCVFPNLQKLCLGRRFCALSGSIATLLSSLPKSVTCLEMKCARLDKGEYIALGRVLSSPSRIKHLVVQSAITDTTFNIFDYIAESISSLVSLNLKGLHYGVRLLAKALRNNSTMDSLSLTCSAINDDGATALANVLKCNSTLKSINLAYNRISAIGATELAKALTNNSTLKSLSLANNSIGDDGATELANALTNNSTMESLNLQQNSVGDIGAAAFAHALECNSTLKSLNLDSNLIYDLSILTLDLQLRDY